MTNYTPEICILRQNDQSVNQIEFSIFDKNLLGAAQDDATVSLYDVNQQKLINQFNTGHKSSVRGLAFSPLNKLLMCSIGLDKNIVFYDINDKIIVKRIKTETPL